MVNVNGQYYSHYKKWEDYQNGLYSDFLDSEKGVSDAFYLLTNPDVFASVCDDLLLQWSVSTLVNMTNPNINKRAWIGQAACCFKYGVPEHLTRLAWSQMTTEQRFSANCVAESKIKQWIAKNKNHGQKEFEFKCS